MARKLPRLQRALDAPALASVAYGEVASSLYFALGIVALHALGLTPAVLGVVGVLFLIVTLSYAEGTTTIGETGGAATFVRVAFNDLAGFVTGWALFLDYLIVIALSALFFPHYLGLAIGMHSIAKHPGDVIVGCVVIAAIGVIRLVRQTRLYSFTFAVPLLDLVTQLLLVVLSAFPAPHGTTQLGTKWQRAPLMGVVYALGPHVAFWVERALRVYVGLTGALILLTAAATSNAGFGRLAYSLGEHGQLPRRFARLSRRSLHSPETVVAAAAISMALLVTTEFT